MQTSQLAGARLQHSEDVGKGRPGPVGEATNNTNMMQWIVRVKLEQIY